MKITERMTKFYRNICEADYAARLWAKNFIAESPFWSIFISFLLGVVVAGWRFL